MTRLRKTRAARLWPLLFGVSLLLPYQATAQPGAEAQAQVPVLRGSLQAADIALVINENDPDSVEIGAYYQSRRGIPARNVIRTRFAAGVAALSAPQFEALYREVQQRTPARVQAYALAWTRPYRADCMGITAAFAFGPDPALCSSSCGPTRISPYFDSTSAQPWSDHRLRPSMMIAGRSVAEALALIDRGIAADYTYPGGTAYLASTEDKARNARAASFAATAGIVGKAFGVAQTAGVLRNRDDVMAYFTGLAQVPGLDTLRFLPGAVADHLTSYGGVLIDSPQMSALQWLSAGATGSYGTVTEPCAHPQKFPHPGVFLLHYLDGDTLLEAYWKSVAWPGEGVFIGEPLARPFGALIRMGAEGWVLEAHTAAPGRRYLVRSAASPAEQGEVIGAIPLRPGRNIVRLPSSSQWVTIDTHVPLKPGGSPSVEGRR